MANRPVFRVLVGGASGLIGKNLMAALSVPSMANGFNPEICSLVRRQPRNKQEIWWDPYEGRIEIEKMEGFDAIINLAGENIGSGEGLLAFTGRWTDRKKHKIMESRRRSTNLLASAVCALEKPPKVLIAASGVGYYGSDLTTDDVITESAPQGGGFLADVVATMEAQLKTAETHGIRTVALRIAPVFTSQGGVLGKLYWPTKLGGGAVMGTGLQYMSWVHLDDLIRSIEFVIQNDAIHGPVNVCSPNPVQYNDFIREFASALHRPVLARLPEWVVDKVFGEMGRETILASLRVVPQVLTSAGFRFLHDNLHDALAVEYAPK